MDDSGQVDVEIFEEEEDPNAEPICPCCLAKVDGDQVLFCPQCGAPIDPVAGMMPFERILAEGFVWRRAGDSPRNWLVVVGIWLLMLPGVVVGMFVLFGEGAALNGQESKLSKGFESVIISMIAICSLLLIIKVTRGFFRQRGSRASSEANSA